MQYLWNFLLNWQISQFLSRDQSKNFSIIFLRLIEELLNFSDDRLMNSQFFPAIDWWIFIDIFLLPFGKFCCGFFLWLIGEFCSFFLWQTGENCGIFLHNRSANFAFFQQPSEEIHDFFWRLNNEFYNFLPPTNWQISWCFFYWWMNFAVFPMTDQGISQFISSLTDCQISCFSHGWLSAIFSCEHNWWISKLFTTTY